MRRAFIALVAALALGAFAVSTASAHALLTSADPAPNAVLKAAPAAITLTFTEAPDPKLSSVRVLDSSGRPATTGPLSPMAGHADELTVPVGRLSDGVYTVAWRTVSATRAHAAASRRSVAAWSNSASLSNRDTEVSTRLNFWLTASSRSSGVRK